MNRGSLRNAMLLAVISLVIAIVTYFLNVLILSSRPVIPFKDAVFLEGVLITLLGLIMLLGSGGIGRTSRVAAMLASSTKAISNGDSIGPMEVSERDAWKPKGLTPAGLILLMTGIFLLVIYFVSSYGGW